MIKNPYLIEIENNLPRILSLYDNDPISKSFGYGDRYHWSWNLIDFNNGTFQGVVNGLSILFLENLWPYKFDKKTFIKRIYSIGMATEKIINKDGSLSEAFPNEGSYCVTALVSFDMLSAFEKINKFFTVEQKKNWLNLISKMINYLINKDEEHAFITNHLATASAALLRWSKLTKNVSAKFKSLKLLSMIIEKQSYEGWYLEYEGFDPGYQSLSTYYLADILRNKPDIILERSLKNSIKFLWNFAHPDGSFGGLYGSRNTRFYYPSGVTYLSQKIPEALALSNFMTKSIRDQKVVTLSAIDEPNLIPIFNCYCENIFWEKRIKNKKSRIKTLPSALNSSKTRYFKDSGIIINSGKKHYTIINSNKGGVIYHFVKDKNCLIDSGVAFKNKRKKFGSTQAYDKSNKVIFGNKSIKIESKVTSIKKRIPSNLDFLILRLLTITIFKSRLIKEFIKKILVKILITNKNYWPIKNVREIKFGENLEVIDNSLFNKNFFTKNKNKIFSHIHMASYGYWQKQDEF